MLFQFLCEFPVVFKKLAIFIRGAEEKRRTYAQSAVMFSTAAALTISVVIALLFVSAFISPRIGTITAVAWIVTMVLLSIGLTLFLLETRTAAARNRERMKRRREGK